MNLADTNWPGWPIAGCRNDVSRSSVSEAAAIFHDYDENLAL